MSRPWIVVIWIVLLVLYVATSAQAGQMDILLNKLVEKGVLSKQEAQEVLEETKAELKRELAAAKADDSISSSLSERVTVLEDKTETAPKWSQKISLKGDLRLRYQTQRGQRMDAADQRDRGRFRFRLGMKAMVTDEFTVKAGLATGGDDPRSTNQTMQDNFSTPDIRMDYAYAIYEPSNLDWLTAKGGKIKSTPWWHPSDLLWDGDINPEGGSLEMYWAGLTSNEDLDVFFNTGIYVLEEFSTRDDPIMWMVQPGFVWDINEDVHLKAAGTYYGFEEMQSAAYHGTATSGTNSLTPAGTVLYDYDSVAGGVELAFDDMFGLDWPRIAFLGEIVHSFDPGSRNLGWLAGVKVGKKKVKKQGDWQVYYNYRILEQDAWPDIFPDSDVYGGSTDVLAHEAVIQYSLRDNVILGLDYYYSDPLNDGSANPAFTSTFGEEHLFQADVIFKF